MTKLVKSAWWIIYYYDETWEPRFLVIKRHAVSGKVERVAPKWKLQDGENYERAALREVSEETWIPITSGLDFQILYKTTTSIPV